MIRNTKKQMLMLAAVASVAFSAPAAFAEAKNEIIVDGKGEIPYVIDARNAVVRSGTGLCWRTGYWSPGAAEAALAGGLPVGCACDSDIVPQSKCTAEKAAMPATPAKPGAPVIKPSADKIKLAADTLFDFDKAVLKHEGKVKLDELAAQAEGLKLEVILAVGHTDRLGSNAYNHKLSEKRAAAVKTYLVSKGIDANRIYTEGKGKSHPVTGTKCNNVKPRKALIECLQPDRRVEIEVIGSK